MKIKKLTVIAFCLLGICAFAQTPQLEEKLMALKQNQDNNKQKLAQYTWTETETISLKGDVKDTKVYQVQMVNGQQQKTEVSNQAAQQGGREGPGERARRRKEERGIPGIWSVDCRTGEAIHHTRP